MPNSEAKILSKSLFPFVAARYLACNGLKNLIANPHAFL
jgi:hypothetical protein